MPKRRRSIGPVVPATTLHLAALQQSMPDLLQDAHEAAALAMRHQADFNVQVEFTDLVLEAVSVIYLAQLEQPELDRPERLRAASQALRRPMRRPRVTRQPDTPETEHPLDTLSTQDLLRRVQQAFTGDEWVELHLLVDPVVNLKELARARCLQPDNEREVGLAHERIRKHKKRYLARARKSLTSLGHARLEA